MKSIFRLYAKTSKGNDSILLKELRQLNIKNPRYDQHLNSFYFNCNWTELFDVCFKSMTLEQMYLQIGQKFMVIDEQQLNSELQKLPIKNYLPMGRSLVQNTTLKILLRQNSVHLSEQVLINLLTTTINKEVVKKEYFKNINSEQSFRREFLEDQPMDQRKSLIETHSKRGNDLSYFQIRDAVQRKWDLEDQQREQQTQNQLVQIQRRLQELKKNHNRLLIGDINPTPKRGRTSPSENEGKELTLQEQLSQSQLQITKLKTELNRLKQFSNENYLASQLSYNPHLVFYMRHNRARLLLKVNKDNLYKHGWKQNVNYGPIRESIAASILHHSRFLEGSDERKEIRLWDPMCGSGTFGLVAATLLGNIPIRSQVQKLFQFTHWPVYKSAYLQEYWKGQQLLKKERGLSYQIILSDKDRQSINYSIDNFRLLLQNQKAQDQLLSNQVKLNPSIPQSDNSRDQHTGHKIQGQLNGSGKQRQPLFPSATPTSETLELVPGQIGFACGDFQEVMKILKSKSDPTKPKNQDSSPQRTAQASQHTKMTIITNLPYLHGRTQAKSPLNQLVSVYKRFNSMLKQNKDLIENAFIIVDKNVESRSHFLNVSSQKWNLIGDYTSGGMEIGLYAWQQNLIKANFQETSLVEGQSINSVEEYEKIQGKLSAQDRQLILKKEKSVQRALIQYRNKISQIDRKFYSLPKHLVRHDLHGRRRLMEKRRKRHLQSAYELFARRRDKLIALKQYARQKLEVRMLRRGTVWKSKNLKLFNSTDKIEQYSEEIKELFEKKIETAIKKEEQFQLKRKIKSGDKGETAKHFNKWNNDEKKMVRQIRKSQTNSREIQNGSKSSQSQGKRSVGNNKRENLSSNYRKR